MDITRSWCCGVTQAQAEVRRTALSSFFCPPHPSPPSSFPHQIPPHVQSHAPIAPIASVAFVITAPIATAASTSHRRPPLALTSYYRSLHAHRRRTIRGVRAGRYRGFHADRLIRTTFPADRHFHLVPRPSLSFPPPHPLITAPSFRAVLQSNQYRAPSRLRFAWPLLCRRVLALDALPPPSSIFRFPPRRIARLALPSPAAPAPTANPAILPPARGCGKAGRGGREG
jgi:hypothetical protein